MNYRLNLGQNQYDLLLMGLRYLELNHDGRGENNEKIDYKPDFRKLLTNIVEQIKKCPPNQTALKF